MSIISVHQRLYCADGQLWQCLKQTQLKVMLLRKCQSMMLFHCGNIVHHDSHRQLSRLTLYTLLSFLPVACAALWDSGALVLTVNGRNRRCHLAVQKQGEQLGWPEQVLTGSRRGKSRTC